MQLVKRFQTFPLKLYFVCRTFSLKKCHTKILENKPTIIECQNIYEKINQTLAFEIQTSNDNIAGNGRS